ncbi:unnamed protein product (macronuclear) [Paramecium tetraurelia]|uniref:Transmembrane protein n=1 Tax=Paramecium tetraurelia TaxID=5888 RepID=A0CY98_PARTE|nr:uncharacterized protein GSPATT00011364001 [Paramecium tetraurelia]CAK75765.1 unnamed protein product [Paramecium tetraurelia]|eukprot:XP_001443162.1 hypothetical protein (macronuclear) [Paramecium tetraurelia strain d4-2]
MIASNELVLGDQQTQIMMQTQINQVSFLLKFNSFNSYFQEWLYKLYYVFFSFADFWTYAKSVTNTSNYDNHKNLNSQPRCSACNEEIGGDGKVFHVLGVKDSMMSFKIGEFGVILTKRIVIGTLLLILTLGVLWYRIIEMPTQQWMDYHQHYNPNITISDTWTDYLEKCSKEKIFQNLQNQQICYQKYIDRTIVDWKGYAIRVEDNQQSLMKFLHHSVNILVKMDPAESEFHPDLLLTADSEIATELSSEIEKLERGSEFIFTAIIKSIGDYQNIRHFHLLNITKLEGYIEIPPHLHQQSRYGNSQQFLAQSTD